ncbi:hypothetical protein ACP6JC_008113 [Aspergillus fumigatus]
MGFQSKSEQHGESDASSLGSGDLQYTAQAGANSSVPTYQEASGAPVEINSPLGYSVGWITVVFLNLSKMIGTGVFSTPSTVLKGAGSVGLALFYWVIGFLMAGSSLAVYLEFSSYFPSRSGSEVVYLEQAYPRPKYFLPTVFAMQSVLFSFSSSNAIGMCTGSWENISDRLVLAQYLFRLAEAQSTPWKLKGVAVASYSVAVLVLAFNTKWSLRFANAIGFVKLVTLIFIGITGLVVLGGHTKIEDPKANFRDAFAGSSSASVYGATNALVKVAFSYAGFENAFNVVNEVKNPVKTLRWSAPLSLLLVATLYMLANIAYFSAASKEEILGSKVVAASIFFQKVFGTSSASRALNFLICLSAFGNLLAVLIGQSRLLRECGSVAVPNETRQGVLPFTKFWTSTRPFGTPLGPYALKWALTVLMILAPPAGDAFNFVVDLGVYPTNAFALFLAIGLLLTRRHRKRHNIPPSGYKAWNVVVGFSILSNLYMVVAPWYPPATGAKGGDVLPRLGGYAFRQIVLQMEDGATAHKLVKVPKEQLKAWDAEHDATGRERAKDEAVSTAVDVKHDSV